MKKELSFIEAMMKIHRSGLSKGKAVNRKINAIDQLTSVEERIKEIFAIFNSSYKNIGNMLFFVMYDIESNKVRRLIVKYLEKKGCLRIQKSIFIGNLPVGVYNEIRDDLAAVQECYENCDSILVVPIPSDYLQSMKVIGKNINIDIITKTKSTLFF